MKVKSESEVAQSCPTPSDPTDCSPSGSSVHGILQARVLEWGAIEILAYPHAKSHEGHSMEAALVVLVGYLTWNYTEATIGNGWS